MDHRQTIFAFFARNTKKQYLFQWWVKSKSFAKFMAIIVLGFILSYYSVANAASVDLLDPTRPPQFLQDMDTMDNLFSLKMTYVSPSVRYAMMGNSKIVYVGDKVGDQRIAEITHDSITLVGKEGTQIITLAPEVQKHFKEKM